jgi:hypothetical protein
MVRLKHEGTLLHFVNPLLRQFGGIQKSARALDFGQSGGDGVRNRKSQCEAHVVHLPGSARPIVPDVFEENIGE